MNAAFRQNPNFGQFKMPQWAKRQGRGRGPISPTGQIASQMLALPDTGIATALMKGLGGYLGAKDRAAYQKAQDVMAEGMMSGGMEGAIENLRGLDSFYSKQALNPILISQALQRGEAESALQKEAREEKRAIAAEERDWEKRKWLENLQNNAATRKQYLIHQLDIQKEREKARLKDVKGSTVDKQIFDQEKALRGEFKQNSQKFYDSQNALEKMRATGKHATAPSDVSLVTLLFKAVDPGSTVTESEQAMIRNSASFGTKVGAYIREAFEGKKLTQQQRDEIVQTAESLVEPLRDEHQMVTDWYKTVANTYGLNPEHIIRGSGIKKAKIPSYNKKQEEENPGYLLDELLKARGL